MTVQLLISTVNSAFFARGDAPPFDDCLVINQVGDSQHQTSGGQPSPGENENQRRNVFNYHESGLSKSRNRALHHAAADIVVIGDDDVRYPPGAQAVIADAFAAEPRVDIITFQAQTPAGAPWKRYAARRRRHNHRTIMRVSSWEIALRLAPVRAAGLKFDERFGLGADFPTGEENIFLLDALRRGLRLLYLPIPIAIHPPQSSGADFRNPELIAAKGAMFRRMFGQWSPPVELAFACKKYRRSDLTCRRFYQRMRAGRLRYDAATTVTDAQQKS